MSRNLKILSVLVGVLALSAVMASAAMAGGTYTAGGYPTTGTSTSPLGNDTFAVDGVPVECEGHFEATLGGPSSHLLVTPRYDKCKFSSFTAKVHMNGCQYTFETPAKVADHHYTAPVEIVCPAGQSITITVPETTGNTCHIQVHPHTPTTGGVTIKNDTPAGDATVQANVSGIHATVIKDGFGCPLAGTGSRTNATYVQHAPITFDSTNGQPVSVSGG